MIIGIIVAMRKEYDQVAKLINHKIEVNAAPFHYIEGMVGENRVVLQQCGIGKVNAAAGTMDLIFKYTPDCIINTGVSGGLDANLNVGDIIISDRLVYHDVFCGEGYQYGQVQGFPLYYDADKSLINNALTSIPNKIIRKGLFCCGDRFIPDKEELMKIKSYFPDCLSVDMESTAIAQICYCYKIPFLGLRIISDIPVKDEDHYQQYLNFWSNLSDSSFEIIRTYLLKLPTKL